MVNVIPTNISPLYSEIRPYLSKLTVNVEKNLINLGEIYAGLH
jgi:hypothetical protein